VVVPSTPSCTMTYSKLATDMLSVNKCRVKPKALYWKREGLPQGCFRLSPRLVPVMPIGEGFTLPSIKTLSNCFPHFLWYLVGTSVRGKKKPQKMDLGGGRFLRGLGEHFEKWNGHQAFRFLKQLPKQQKEKNAAGGNVPSNYKLKKNWSRSLRVCYCGQVTRYHGMR
jgi:hypothetical protein